MNFKVRRRTVERKNIITKRLNSLELNLIREMAERAQIGGYSQIHLDEEKRKQSLAMDQFIGQIGNYIGAKILDGTPFPKEYYISRMYANRHPNEGDGGSDIPGTNIDFKTSLMRGELDPMSYRLIVRPNERHNDWIYVLVLVEPQNISIFDWKTAVVHIVGWATDDMLLTIETEGIFRGAYILPTIVLYPFLPIKRLWMI